ncbi:hypothetical protein [Pseudovibrio sp. SPO723]|uniref:hypothetical protein n=1 Tax=Nesiotobacter zosterae TaxID=392721 RepID=UPI0029C39FBC|nr:hypothetical protein [Pseudovibrio sp. SPO723]MDX5593807.1 hypothetical protein [Pseudovibrio sp. SPO723]
MVSGPFEPPIGFNHQYLSLGSGSSKCLPRFYLNEGLVRPCQVPNGLTILGDSGRTPRLGQMTGKPELLPWTAIPILQNSFLFLSEGGAVKMDILLLNICFATKYFQQ